MTSFNKEKVTYYQRILENLNERIKANTITPQEIQQGHNLAKEYYSYIGSCGVEYGNMAFDILENKLSSAKLANQHLENEAKHYGKSPEEIQKIKSEYPILLAYHDTTARADSQTGLIKDDLDKENRAIYEYHVLALQHYKLKETAWAGTFWELFAGSGSWRIWGIGTSQSNVQLSTSISALVNDETKEGINARDSFKVLYRTFIEMDLKHPLYDDRATLIIFDDTEGLIMGSRSFAQTDLSQSLVEKVFYSFVPYSRDNSKIVNGLINDVPSSRFYDNENKNPGGYDKSKITQDSSKQCFDTSYTFAWGDHRNINEKIFTEHSRQENEERNKAYGSFFDPKFKTLTDAINGFNTLSHASTRTHEVKKGDTVWKIAQNYGIKVEDILNASGNEYLGQHRFTDDFNRDNVKIQPGYKINIPGGREYQQYTCNMHSTYGKPIHTTNGHYSFINDFNQGSYNSVRCGKAQFSSGCESHPATIVPAGSNRSSSWR